MSVIVKEVEMPKWCGDCPFCDWYDTIEGNGKCAVNKQYFCDLETNRDNQKRPDWCPLIDISELGQNVFANVIDRMNDEIVNWLGGTKK